MTYARSPESQPRENPNQSAPYTPAMSQLMRAMHNARKWAE